MSRNRLFSSYQIEGYFARIYQNIDEKVIALNKELIGNVEDYVQKYTEEFRLVPPVLVGEVETDIQENIEIDVSYRRDISSRTGKATGSRFLFYNNFEGDGDLFLATPNPWSSLMPTGDVDNYKKVIVWYFDRLHEETKYIKEQYENNMNRLNENLANITSTVNTFNEGLPEHIRGRLIDRENFLKKNQSDLDSLGFKRRSI